MIRFKVIKCSHLLLCAAVVLLVLVVGGFILSIVLSDHGETVNAQANLVANPLKEAKAGTVFASSDILPLDPDHDDGIRISILPAETASEAAGRPSVLIYHTHTHEAYEQVSDDPYVAIEAWRTFDHDHSVVRVGDELARLLTERGFEVVHDTTDHEQNELGTAYVRSLDTLMRYERSFDLYIDLHRDAYNENVASVSVKDDGGALARLMLLVGNGNGFEIKPHYEENLLFAQTLTERVNALKPDLCRDVLVKDGRYNQNIGVFSILVEVGHNRNTLEEALRSLPYLADGIYSLMISEPDDTLVRLQSEYRLTAEN